MTTMTIVGLLIGWALWHSGRLPPATFEDGVALVLQGLFMLLVFCCTVAGCGAVILAFVATHTSIGITREEVEVRIRKGWFRWRRRRKGSICSLVLDVAGATSEGIQQLPLA